MDNRVYYGEYSLKYWIELILKGNIVLPEYQRYFVWELRKVETLISTFKNNQFVPPVTIGAYQNGDNNQNLVLDGQQRLTSILLSYLGLYPDKETYKKTIETFVNENDDEEEIEERLDSVIHWKFDILLEKGQNKEEILRNIVEGNYKRIDFEINENFLESTFLGFSYLVPSVSNESEQQKYYSSVFRNINIQGQSLLPQESRESLYFLDKSLVEFFKPEFSEHYVVKIVSNETRIDFVRCLAFLSQYHHDNSERRVARSYKPKLEKYYEEFIYAVISDEDSKYGKFTQNFPNKEYDNLFSTLSEHLDSLQIPKQFPSIIDMDMFFFGLSYSILFKKQVVDQQRGEEIINEIRTKIEELKADHSHSKSPNNLGHLRHRIFLSIQVFAKYAS